MKSIGIVGAMAEEIALIKEKTDIISSREIVGIEFHVGKMHGNSVVLVCSGIGKVNAAICTQALIDMYGVDYIINVGVAGALSTELEIGDIVISSDVVQHDMDVTFLGYEPGYIFGINEIYVECDAGTRDLLIKAADSLDSVSIHVGTVASGDQFVYKDEQRRFITEHFNALCVEMEGASIGHVCKMNNVPFCVVRAISDSANDDSVISFNEFMEIAADISTHITTEYLNLICAGKE